MLKKLLFSIFMLSFSVLLPSVAQDAWYYHKQIKNVVFENLKTVKSSDLDGVTSSYIGKSFTDELIGDLYDRIYSLDYFDDVEIRAAKNNDDGKTVNIILSVHEKAVVTKVVFVGNRQIHSSDLKSKISIKEQDIFIENKMLLDERALRNYYLEKGYTAATVSVSSETNDDGVVVKFEISEGKQTVVKAVNFEGNRIVSAKTLKGKISIREVSLFNKGSFQESSISKDSQVIVAYYRDRGYVDARVLNVKQDSVFNEEKRRNELTITFEISEGSQYTFGGLDFNGNKVFTTEELLSYLRLKPGSTYNESKFLETRSIIQNLYYENGYTSNRFGIETHKDTENLVVSYTMNIQENARSHVEKIIIKGNEKTKDFVITREIPIVEGDIFSNAKIVNGLRNLYNLQFFSAVNPEVVQGSEENLVDIVFTVEEQSTTSLDFGFTFSGVSDPSDFPVAIFAKLAESNLFGEGKSLSASTSLSTSEQSVSFGYGQNWLWDMPISTNFSIGYTHSRNYALRNKILPSGDLDDDHYYMEYGQHEFSLGASVGRRWVPDFAILTLSAGVSTSIINNIYDDDYFVPNDSSITHYHDNWEPKNSIWTSFSMDGRNISYDPSSGWFASQRLAWYGLMKEGVFSFAPNWGETEFYLRTDTKLEKYFTLVNQPITENWSLRLVLMGYSGLSLQLPTADTSIKRNNQLYIDGRFYGRGWTIYNKDEGRGQALWNNTLELRMPVIPGILSLDGWFDACAISDTAGDFFGGLNKEDWYFSFGPSLRFSMQQFPLRLIFANTFKYKDGRIVFVDEDGNGDNRMRDNWHFVLSFNLTNR